MLFIHRTQRNIEIDKLQGSSMSWTSWSSMRSPGLRLWVFKSTTARVFMTCFTGSARDKLSLSLSLSRARARGVIRQGVVLTDLQSSIDCQ